MSRRSLALAMLGVVLVAAPVVRAATAPNIVFLLVDDWGWTDAGCFGSDLYQTPNIDKLAADGIRFTNGYAACTVCSPTRAAIMAGKYPPKTGVTNWISNPSMRLKHEEVTIAEALKAAGYRTFHVGKWHLCPRGAPDVDDYNPDKQGFDVNIAGNHWGAPGSFFHPYTTQRKKMGPLPPGGKDGDYLTDRLTDEAIKLVASSADKPFFLYLPYYAVHTPIQGRADRVDHYKKLIEKRGPGTHNNATYAAMVHAVDESVGRIRAKLKELGIAQNTVIFLTGDNGGLMKPTKNKPLRAGKGSAYEGGTRVPTIIAGARVASDAVCDTPVISVDYYPTILELAGAKGDAKHNAEVDGVSLGPLLKDPKAGLPDRALYWHYPHSHGGGARPHGAIREGDWRLVRFYGDDRVELYNLKDDLSEVNDLASSNPEKAAALRTKLDAWLKATGAKFPGPGAGKKKKKQNKAK